MYLCFSSTDLLEQVLRQKHPNEGGGKPSVLAGILAPERLCPHISGSRALLEGNYSTDLCALVAEARILCILAYLNGAALVTYGVPMRFEMPLAEKKQR